MLLQVLSHSLVHRARAPPFTAAKGKPCSVEDYLRSIPGEGVDKALDREVEDMDRAIIARAIPDWEELLPFFGLSTDVDRSTILGNNPHSVEVQR